MPQFADFEPARRWFGQHPRVRFVDLLLPDQLGIPRGKRVTAAELETVHDSGLLLPASMFALDALGGTVQATGLGFDEHELFFDSDLAGRAGCGHPSSLPDLTRARCHALFGDRACRACPEPVEGILGFDKLNHQAGVGG